VAVPPASEGRGPARLDWIVDYDGALASIAREFETLGLPRPDAVIHLTPDRRGFEAALIESGYSPEFARTTSRALDAVGGHRRVTVNEAALAELPWGDRLAMLAHELAHGLQYDLGGGRRGASEQWLREGFAEWVARRVVDSLGGRSVAAMRRRSWSAVSRLRRPGPPALAALATFPQWVEVVGGRDGDAVYEYAYLAADFLIERRGLPAALGYFALFATREDREACFREAFGDDPAAFEAAWRKRLGF